jgi:ATP-dependent protease HslVU (ClpYQ) ATPase subunit
VKTDLRSIKAELLKLTDVEYLKKELNRLAAEIRKFDVHNIKLTPQAKQRLKSLEKRFAKIVKVLADAQKQMDGEVHKLMAILQKTKHEAEVKLKPFGFGGAKKKTKRKAASAPRKASRKKTPSV